MSLRAALNSAQQGQEGAVEAFAGSISLRVVGCSVYLLTASAISSRSRQRGLKFAVEGYIKNIKISNEGETTIIEAKAYRSQVALSGQALEQQAQGRDEKVSHSRNSTKIKIK